MKSFRREAIDQTAHFLAALIILVMFAMVDFVLIGLVCGFALGVIREVTEESPKVTLTSLKQACLSWPDLFFWSVGGLAAKALTLFATNC